MENSNRINTEKVERINDKKYFGLIGYPLGHSLSAIIHKELLRLANIEGEYILKEIKPEELEEEFYSVLRYLDGFNVTIPHKVNIIPYLDTVAANADLFGAVNTVRVDEDEIRGFNTDCSGFLRAIDMADIELGGRVLLCGAGGVSRMLAFEAMLAECDLTIAVREEDIPAANTIKQEIEDKLGMTKCRVILLSEAECGYDLIINGTPVGMYPDVDACPLSEEVVKSAGAVFDVIYNPIETKLIRYAREAGIKCSGGLSMLVWQAAVAEELWTGAKFSRWDIVDVIKVARKELQV